MGLAGSVKHGEEPTDICGDGSLNGESDNDILFMSSVTDKGLKPPCCTGAKSL